MLVQTPVDNSEFSMSVRQGGRETLSRFNLVMDFVMQAFLDKCSNIDIKFLPLKHSIPASTKHSERTIIEKRTLALD